MSTVDDVRPAEDSLEEFEDPSRFTSARTRLPRTELPEIAGPVERVRTSGPLDDKLTVLGAVAAGFAMALLLGPVLGVIGWGWVPIVTYLWFVGFYAVLTFVSNSGPAVRDRFFQVLLRSAGVVVVASLALVVVFTFGQGGPVWADIFAFAPDKNPLHFIVNDMSGVGPLDGIDVGGIFYALIGTLEQIGIALIITVPLGLTAAIFLGEVGGRYARIVRTIVEAMTALPSVVAGLFIYSTVIILFTHENSGFAAALAITVLMLPIMIRAADIALRLVPGNLREAGLALGASKWSTVWRVVLPTMRSGLTTAIILATAHGIGETAPVLLTSGVTQVTNFNPFANPQTSLPLAALEFIKAGRTDLKVRGYATAAFLLLLVLVLFLIARIIGGQEAGKISDRQARALQRRSQRTMRRIERAAVAPAPLAAPADAPSPFPLDMTEPPDSEDPR